MRPEKDWNIILSTEWTLLFVFFEARYALLLHLHAWGCRSPLASCQKDDEIVCAWLT